MNIKYSDIKPGDYILVEMNWRGSAEAWRLMHVEGCPAEDDPSIRAMLMKSFRYQSPATKDWSPGGRITVENVKKSHLTRIHESDLERCIRVMRLKDRREVIRTLIDRNLIDITDVMLAEAEYEDDPVLNSPHSYVEFMEFLAVFASFGVHDPEEHNLMSEFLTEIQPSVEKLIAKRTLLGKPLTEGYENLTP